MPWPASQSSRPLRFSVTSSRPCRPTLKGEVASTTVPPCMRNWSRANTCSGLSVSGAATTRMSASGSTWPVLRSTGTTRCSCSRKRCSSWKVLSGPGRPNWPRAAAFCGVARATVLSIPLEKRLSAAVMAVLTPARSSSTGRGTCTVSVPLSMARWNQNGWEGSRPATIGCMPKSRLSWPASWPPSASGSAKLKENLSPPSFLNSSSSAGSSALSWTSTSGRRSSADR